MVTKDDLKTSTFQHSLDLTQADVGGGDIVVNILTDNNQRWIPVLITLQNVGGNFAAARSVVCDYFNADDNQIAYRFFDDSEVSYAKVDLLGNYNENLTVGHKKIPIPLLIAGGAKLKITATSLALNERIYISITGYVLGEPPTIDLTDSGGSVTETLNTGGIY